MTIYTDRSIDRVRDAVDMLALVGAKVELTRRGENSYFGRCPFHDERTPSFHVRPDDKHYHCFGCQASGDAIAFVRATEGLDFEGAIVRLAVLFHVTLDAEVWGADRFVRLRALLERATRYFETTLLHSPVFAVAEARGYLTSRGITAVGVDPFHVGYALGDLANRSRDAGFTDHELRATGLIYEDGSDVFRDRITFPVTDLRGRVIAFSARAVGDGNPKYLNSPDCEMFSKGASLFGVGQARRNASTSGRVTLVEGQLDVLAFHQVGGNAVGMMGSAFTSAHADLIARLAPIVVVAMDGDTAGAAALARIARVVAETDLELRVMPLPDGLDPADLQLQSPATLSCLPDVPFAQHLVNQVLS